MNSLTSERIAAIDKSSMLERVLAMPRHFEDALASAQKNGFNLPGFRPNGIVVAGMGGSAISGDVVRGVTLEELAVPMIVCRSYDLPSWVDTNSLVVVSSYSGNTEESLAALMLAQKRSARIVCITSGGKVGELAQKNGWPVYSLPPGFPPRAALAHLTVPLLVVLHRLQRIADPAAQVAETNTILEKLGQSWGPQFDEQHNLAKYIAAALTDRLPIVYAAHGLFEIAAWRWKEQFCENAEILSWHNVFPEMNHNELMGWGQRLQSDHGLQVIYLRDRQDHPRVQKRMEITRELIEKTSVPVIEAWSEGQSRLARLFSLIFLGDLVSVYVAILSGVDPTPVRKINLLKERLEQFKS
ncbi:MAG: bifunctional phosphoglucose/phosphomannose isomerase [bacterium]